MALPLTLSDVAANACNAYIDFYTASWDKRWMPHIVVALVRKSSERKQNEIYLSNGIPLM